MGTIDRCPRRKYHGLLTVREPGVGEPLNMVAEVEEWLKVGDETVALHSYNWGNTVEPNGVDYLSRFEPLPSWTYEFAGVTFTRELWLEDDADAVWIRYTIEGLTEPADLRLRPLIRCRPIHALTVANPFMNGELDIEDGESLRVAMHPYKNVPALIASLHGAAGVFRPDGHWYEGVHYEWERERGYDDVEDLFTPGEFRLELERRRRVLRSTRDDAGSEPRAPGAQLRAGLAPLLRSRARRRGRRIPGRALGESHGNHRRLSLVWRMGAGLSDRPARPLPGP